MLHGNELALDPKSSMLTCMILTSAQYTSIGVGVVERERLSRSAPSPPIAFLRMRWAKLRGPSSSAPLGGPRGWRTSTLETTRCAAGVCGTFSGRPRPRPSYSFCVAASRGESGGAKEPLDCGVAGELPSSGLPADLFEDTSEAASSLSAPSSEETATVAARGTAGVKRSGVGRLRAVGVAEEGDRALWGPLGRGASVSIGGGVTLTSGIAGGGERRRTELLFEARRQLVAVSDLEGGVLLLAEA